MCILLHLVAHLFPSWCAILDEDLCEYFSSCETSTAAWHPKNAFVERDKYDKWDASFPKLEMWRWDGHSCSFWNFVPVRFSRTLKNPLISQPRGPTLRPRKNKYQTNQSQFRALNCCVCPNDPKCHFQNCHLAISTVLPACNRKTIQP